MQDLNAYLFHTPSAKAWKRIGIYPHHGINLPLSALHSQNSCGSGEFYDLVPLIEWCQKLKLDCLQLLPLYHTGKDPSPYNPISSCALHFIYISLHALPYLESFPELSEKLKILQQMNKTEKVCFEEVFALKLEWLKNYVNATDYKTTSTQEYISFIEQNPWVKPLALFQALQHHFGTSSWDAWPQEFQNVSPQTLELIYPKFALEITFECILQYFCFEQLKTVKKIANEKGVFLMGDSPLLIQKQSADVWQFPQFFNIEVAAGAPPDIYNTDGQYWGFPLFNWETIRQDNFSWWKLRLKFAENFFDLFRIDHALGLFRIWAIPLTLEPKQGHFVPKDEKLWKEHGRELLFMIVSSTKMLCIAEDLGIVPKCVPPTLKELGICSTKVMRWQKEYEDTLTIIPIKEYPPISLTTVSTHDSETLTLWWSKYPEESKEFADFKRWNFKNTLEKEEQEEILYDSHHSTSLFHINLLQEYLALFPELIHDTPEEERINTPGRMLPTNWTYRFFPSVEEIVSHEKLFATMQKIVH